MSKTSGKISKNTATATAKCKPVIKIVNTLNDIPKSSKEELQEVKEIFSKTFETASKIEDRIKVKVEQKTKLAIGAIKAVDRHKRLTADEYSDLLKDFKSSYPDAVLAHVPIVETHNGPTVAIPVTHAEAFVQYLNNKIIQKLTHLAVGLATDKVKVTVREK